MKRFTTIVCCVAMMIIGVATAFQNFTPRSNNTIQAATTEPLAWNTNVAGKLPLDFQLTLDERTNRETPKVRDSVVIRDSVVTKVRWKTRYKDVASRTLARDVGEHLTPVTPDSMPSSIASTSTVGREEQPTDIVVVSKTPSIQLSVDGEVVYSTNDNHSAESSQ